jgi:hypothetical protein
MPRSEPASTEAFVEEVAVAAVRRELSASFRDAMLKSVAGIIEAGRILIDGKTRLAHGQFTDWVAVDLKLSNVAAVALRKAEMLMLLARHPVIANPCHWHAFPPSPRTLYELSLLRPSRELLARIADGTINSATSREEAIALRTGRPQDGSADFPFGAALFRLIRRSENISEDQALRDLHEHGDLDAAKVKAFGQRVMRLGENLAEVQ